MSLELNSVKITGGKSSTELKPAEKGGNYYRQQPTFAALQEKTMSTPYVDTVDISVKDNGANDRDKTATDIAARPLNVSGPGMLKNSDMEAAFNKINADDFKNGKLVSESGVIRGFSKEKNGYGIVDKKGNIFTFNRDGQFTGATFKTSEAAAAYQAEINAGHSFFVMNGESFANQCGYSPEDDKRFGYLNSMNK